MPSKYEEMRKRHRDALSGILSLLLPLYLAYLFWPNMATVWETLQNGSRSSSGSFLIRNLVLGFLPLAVPAVGHWSGFFLFIFGDFYYTLDNRLIGLRKQVDIIIAQNLFSAAEVDLPDCDLLDEKTRKAYMRVFYRFVDDDKTVNKELVEQVFVHWGNYFNNLSAAFVAAVLTVAQIGTMFIVGWRNLALGLIVAAIFLVVFLVGCYRIRPKSKTRSAILTIPVEEIHQVQLKAKSELSRALREEVLSACR